MWKLKDDNQPITGEESKFMPCLHTSCKSKRAIVTVVSETAVITSLAKAKSQLGIHEDCDNFFLCKGYPIKH